MPEHKINFVFFGSSTFSGYVREELERAGYLPLLNIESARDPLPELPEADIYIVASFGKILPKSLIDAPKHRTLNVHPSLLPKLRGAAPLQYTILEGEKPGVTIMQMNEKMDEGPIVAQEEVDVGEDTPHYRTLEETLGRHGGMLLARILPDWCAGTVEAREQDHAQATYTKKISKLDADITNDTPELALRKIRAYEVWPRARINNLIVTDAHLVNGELVIDKVIPPGKKEMDYKDYQRGRH